MNVVFAALSAPTCTTQNINFSRHTVSPSTRRTRTPAGAGTLPYRRHAERHFFESCPSACIHLSTSPCVYAVVGPVHTNSRGCGLSNNVVRVHPPPESCRSSRGVDAAAAAVTAVLLSPLLLLLLTLLVAVVDVLGHSISVVDLATISRWF